MSNTVHPTISRTHSRLSQRKLYLAILAASQIMAGQVQAGPEGGTVVGGAGVIDQSGVDTIIHQATERLAIDWQTFNLGSDERVQFIQPSASSIALNRVLSHSGSEIHGRIDANGHVLIVNPNGVFFGENSQINVGGMIASGLNIDPSDFMNGEFTLTSLDGTEGKVVNSGIINASTGGSVTLVGRQVQNDGYITANLGAVNLIAGNEAVVTFDSSGLLGFKITKEILQSELGVDAAVINNGEIKAESGRILLTASTSRDVFSQVVNSGEMGTASSVLVHDDGTFTLGAGADVVNTGGLSVAAESGTAGAIAVIGENIVNSGLISADVIEGKAGQVELHSADKTELTGNGSVSAQATHFGMGGSIKVLGNKVGLFDHATVNSSGVNGGGEILIGGDKTGSNPLVRNADFIYLGELTDVRADGLINGDGGRLIAFANDTARIYGGLSVRGGENSGDGGFVETSGLKGFEIHATPEISAANGLGGVWLIDPFNITINNDADSNNVTDTSPYTSDGVNATIGWGRIATALRFGNVVVQTGEAEGVVGGDIILATDLTFSPQGANNSVLTFIAHRDINTNGFDITASENDVLSLIFNAGQNINISGSTNITTNGGNFTAHSTNFNLGDLDIDTGSINTNGGNVTINSNVVNGEGAIGGAIKIYNPIITRGGSFIVGSEDGYLDPLSFENIFFDDLDNITRNGLINTAATNSGYGEINIRVTGDATLGQLRVDNASNPTGTNDSNNVIVNAGGDIILAHEFNFNNSSNHQNQFIGNAPALRLTSGGNIHINQRIYDSSDLVSNQSYFDTLNVNLSADENIFINADIYTAGGNFSADGVNFTSTALINTDLGKDGVNSSSTTGGHVTLTMTGDVSLNSVVTESSRQTCGDTTCGNFSVTSARAITASGILDINGVTTLNAGDTGDITFENALNSFSGEIRITEAQDVAISNNGGVVLGNVTTRDLSINASGNIEGSGNLVARTATFTAGGNNITLDSSENDFTTAIFDTTGEVVVRDRNDIILSTQNNLASLRVTAGGSIFDLDEDNEDNTGISVAGLARFRAGSGDSDVILNHSENDFSGHLLITRARDAVIVDANGGVILGDASGNFNIGRNLSVTANNGGISQAATISAQNGMTTLSTTADILLNDGSNNFNELSITSAGSAEVVDGGNISLGTVLLTGDSSTKLDVSAATISQLDGSVIESQNGAAIELTATDSIFTQNINTSGSSTPNENGGNGGNVTLRAPQITAGYINTSGGSANGAAALNGGTAGAIELIAQGGDSRFIRLAGDLIAEGGAGVNGGTTAIQSNITVALQDSGIVNLQADNFFTSDVNITSNNTGNTLVGFDLASTWATTGANSGTLLATTPAPAQGTVSFQGFETLIGGADVDVFNIEHTNSWAFIGGNGDDIFHINAVTSGAIAGGMGNDEFNIGANKIGTLTGDDGDNVFNILSSGLAVDLIVGSSSGNDQLHASDNVNQWTVIDTNRGRLESGGQEVVFQSVGYLFGGTDVDNFTIEASGINITLSGGGFPVGSSDSLTAYSDTNNSNTWMLTGVQSGTLSNSGQITFSEMLNLYGGTGVDIFEFSDSYADAAFDGALNGGAGDDTFILARDVLGGVIGGDGNDVFSIQTQITSVITGDDGDDEFRFDGSGSVVTSLNGGNGENTIIGRNAPNLWHITDVNSGSITDSTTEPGDQYVAAFENIQNLTGGSGIDRFELSGGHVVSIIGMGGSDVLVGDGLVNQWNLATNNSGSLSSTIAGDAYGIEFSGIENLLGGSDVDTFTFNFNGEYIGAIDAVGANNIVQIATDANITVDLGESINGVANANIVLGNGEGTIVVNGVAGDDHTWTISDLENISQADGVNDGAVTDGVNTIRFIDFANLTGSNADDIFILSSGALITGIISGAGGANSLTNNNTQSTWTLTESRTGELTNSSSERIAAFQGIQTAVGSGTDTLIGRNQQNDWQITAEDEGSVQQQGNASDLFNFLGMADITGGTQADRFTFSNEGSISGITNGGGGTDTLIARNTTNTWLISDENQGTVTDEDASPSVETYADFLSIENLVGGDGVDRFNFSTGGSIVDADGGDGVNSVSFAAVVGPVSVTLGTSTVNGVRGINQFVGNNTDSTLIALSGTNTWNIFNFDTSDSRVDGVNDGQVILNGNVSNPISFIDFNNLQGGAGIDTFDLTGVNGTIVGEINGGEGGGRIFSRAVDTQWRITGDGAGDFSYAYDDTGMDSIANTTFISIEELIGSSAEDIFHIESLSVINIDGGTSGGVIDMLDMSDLAEDIQITLGSSSVGSLTVNNIERINANEERINTLTGYIGGSEWLVSGTNSGLVVAGLQSTEFSGFSNLQGVANQSDIFTFGASGIIRGWVDGGANSDNEIIGRNTGSSWALNGDNSSIALTANNSVYLNAFSNIRNLTGGSANDMFTIAADASFVGDIAGGDGINTFAVTNGENTFLLNTSNSGTVNGQLNFSQINQLNGGSGNDTFNFSFNGLYGGAINAGDGFDVVSFQGVDDPLNVSLGANSIHGVTNALRVVGNGNPNSSLVGVNSGTNTWTISNFGVEGVDGINDGTVVNNTNNTIQFVNFSNLVGGLNAVDNFVINSSGQFNGLINGVGLNNSLSKTDGNNVWSLAAEPHSGNLNTNTLFENIQQINGGTGTDTLIAANQNNDWIITHNNEGSLGASGATTVASRTRFTGVENLTGNTAIDKFTFEETGLITGVVDGGTSSGLITVEDFVDLTRITGGVSVELGNGSTAGRLHIVNVEQIEASDFNPNSNFLFGASDAGYDWQITGDNAGTISPTGNDSNEAKVSFENFGNLRGGTNDDNFKISAGEITGVIHGGDGDGVDSIDYSASNNNVAISIGSSGDLGITEIDGIEGVIGNNDGTGQALFNSSISVTGNANSVWNIDGLNDGDLVITLGDGSTKTIWFTNFNIINGGGGTDTFNLSASGALIGFINGGLGNNTFNATGSNQVQNIHVLESFPATIPVNTAVSNLSGFSGIHVNSSIENSLFSLQTANDWVINANNSGALNSGLVFSGFANLIGGEYRDTFTFFSRSSPVQSVDGGNAAGIDTVVDRVDLTSLSGNIIVGVGATAEADLNVHNIEQLDARPASNSTLVADNLTENTWSIDAENTGTLNGRLGFSGFVNLRGRETTDVFNFIGVDAYISGVIDGGAGADTINLVDAGRALDVHLLNAVPDVMPNAINVVAIERVNGIEGITNTLFGSDIQNAWVIDGNNSGALNNANGSGLTFTHVENLVGGSGDDTFVFSSSGALDGYLDGGNHLQRDTVDMSLLANAEITLGSGNTGYRNIERYIGNNDERSIFRAANTNNIWTLEAGLNRGNIGGTIEFEGFANLYGGEGNDTFNFNQGELTGSVYGGIGNDTFNINSGVVRGAIYGNTGNDTLNVTVNEGESRLVRFVGGEDTNEVTVSGGSMGYRTVHAAAIEAGGELRYTDASSNDYTISYGDTTRVNDNVASSLLTINGTLQQDEITLRGNRYLLNDFTDIRYAGKSNLTIFASANDSVYVDAVINIPQQLRVQNASLSGSSTSRINATDLHLDAIGSVGSAEDRLRVNVTNLRVTAATGDIYLQEQNSLNITGFGSNNRFDVELQGSLTSDVALSSQGDLAIVAGENIILDSANTLSGRLDLTAGDAITLENTTSTNLGAVQAQTLNVNSTAAINGLGRISVTGLATFASGGNIELNDVTNSFNSVAITSAQDASLVDTGSLTLENINTFGLLRTSSATLIQNGRMNVGRAMLTATNGSATLGNSITANQAITVSAQGISVNGALTGGSINLNGTSGNINLGRELQTTGAEGIIIAGNQITQSADVTSASDISIAALGGFNMVNGARLVADSGSVSVTSEGNITAGNITARNDIFLQSLGAIQLNADLTSTAGQVNLNAINALMLAGNISGFDGVNVQSTEGSLQQQAQINSTQGDITATVAGDIVMANNALSTATQGNIRYSAANIGVSTLSAQVGTVSLNAVQGAITNNNSGNDNVIAQQLVMDAISGIGSSGTMKTQVSELSASNHQGNINLENSIELTIDRLRTNGNISLVNKQGDVILDNTNGLRFSPDETDARLAGGTSNANYEIGTLSISVDEGSLLARGPQDLRNPDITAYNANLLVKNEIGSAARPLVVYVKNNSVIFGRRSWGPLWGFGLEPANPVNNSIVQSNLSDLLAAGNEQLVEVETLDEVDPAIFTSVRNYFFDDISIMMPRDQRYDDDDEWR